MASLTFLNLQQRVAFHVHGSAATTNISSEFLGHIKYAINYAISEATNRVKTFHVRKSGSVTLVASQADYDLPDELVEVVAGTVYYNDGTSSYEMKAVTEQEWNRHGGNALTSEGTPDLYTVKRWDATASNWKITFYPTPESAKTDGVQFEYYAYPATLSADGDLPPLPPHLHEGLIHGAIVLGFPDYLSDGQVARFHVTAWETYLRNLRRHADPVKGRRVSLRESSSRSVVRNPLRNFTIP